MVRSGREKAFTLIELLVVISIIGLILAIMLPALSRAKEQAYRAVCSSNLKQYGIAGYAYTAENDGKLPPADEWLFSRQTVYDYVQANGGNWCRWHDGEIVADGALWPYLESEDVHLCPSFKGLARSVGAEHDGHDPQKAIRPRYSYTMNGYLGTESVYWPNDPTPGNRSDNPRCGVLRLSAVKKSSTMMFAEEGLVPVEGLSRYALNDNVLLARFMPLGPSDYCDSLGGYHGMKGGDMTSGVANYVCVDGSIGQGRPGETFELAYPHAMTAEMVR